MNIVLTNDDGFESPGIQVLREELEKIGNVILVAPKNNMSAVSHSLTLFNAMEVRKLDDGYDGYWVDGTPADCVKLVEKGIIEMKPDVVVSGINCGANVADDINYSGTVSAAREAILCGMKGIAVSVDSHHKTCDFRPVAIKMRELLPKILEMNPSPKTLINVNFPYGGEYKGVVITKMGKRIYQDSLDDLGDGRFRLKLVKPQFVKEEGTDVVALDEGYISITPLQLDLTDHNQIDNLKGLEE